MSDIERRAEEAQRILMSDVYKDAFEKLRTKYMLMLANPENKPRRDEYCDRLHFLAQHIKEMEQVMLTGQIAEINKRPNPLLELLKRF